MKTFAEFLEEDGGGAGSAPAGMGTAPTVTTAGIGSITKPDGTPALPPVFKTKYKKKNEQGAKENLGRLRKMVGTVNV